MQILRGIVVPADRVVKPDRVAGVGFLAIAASGGSKKAGKAPPELGALSRDGVTEDTAGKPTSDLHFVLTGL